ncbi:MAG: hypothetical protein H6723_19585 [Sandaracinus sp.]|nr:hypothetical protein [Sandaracinus sp.]
MRHQISIGTFLLLIACGGGTASCREAEAPQTTDITASRSAFADAESIAEVGAHDVLVELVPVFATVGITAEPQGEGAFRLSNAAGQTALLAQREEGGRIVLASGDATFTLVDEQGDWERATLALLSALDHALDTLGAHVRAYARYFGGNEQFVVIMTPAEQAAFDAQQPESERLHASH